MDFQKIYEKAMKDRKENLREDNPSYVKADPLAACCASHEKSQKSVKKSLFHSKNHKNNL
jgi:hypothetical protein